MYYCSARICASTVAIISLFIMTVTIDSALTTAIAGASARFISVDM